jgi:hypothetical protein
LKKNCAGQIAAKERKDLKELLFPFVFSAFFRGHDFS